MPPPFRRPASLSPHGQDQLPGDPDPALSTELAHSSAEALLSGVRRSADERVVQRVLRLARTEGLDDLAALWSTSPADTLPGALWRLHVLHSWVQQDPEDVRRRYEEGTRTVPGLRYLAGLAEPVDVAVLRRTLDEILQGAFTGDLAVALGRAAAVLMLVAYGTAHLADAQHDRDHQRELTAQASRLLATGEELAVAARCEAEGELS